MRFIASLMLTVFSASFACLSYAETKKTDAVVVDETSGCKNLKEEMTSWKVQDYSKHVLTSTQFERATTLASALPEPTEEKIQTLQKGIDENFAASLCTSMQTILANSCDVTRSQWIQTLTASAEEAKKHNDGILLEKYKQVLKTEFSKKRYPTMISAILLAGQLERSLKAELWENSSKDLKGVVKEKGRVKKAAQEWTEKYGKDFEMMGSFSEEACDQKSVNAIAKAKEAANAKKGILHDLSTGTKSLTKLQETAKNLK